MPPIRVEKAGEIILKISALSTSLAQRPSIKLITIAKTEMHRVVLTISVTYSVSLSLVSGDGFLGLGIGFLVISFPVQVRPCSHEQLYYATMWSLPCPPTLLGCSRSPCIRLTCSRAHSCRATPSSLCGVWSGRGLCKQSRRTRAHGIRSWLRLQLAPRLTVTLLANA